jgi:hypothetical protein
LGDPIVVASGKIRPGVLAELCDLHHGPELRRLAQLALADRSGVGVAHRHESIGDLLARDAARDLFADLLRARGDQFDALGRVEFGLGATPSGARPQRRGETSRLAQRSGGQGAGLTGQAQRQLLALPGPAGDRAVQPAQPAEDRPQAISHLRRCRRQRRGPPRFGGQHPGGVLRKPEVRRVTDIGLEDRRVDPRSPHDKPPLGRLAGRARDHGHRDLVDHAGPQPLDELADRHSSGTGQSTRSGRNAADAASQTRGRASHSPSHPSAP